MNKFFFDNENGSVSALNIDENTFDTNSTTTEGVDFSFTYPWWPDQEEDICPGCGCCRVCGRQIGKPSQPTWGDTSG